MSPVDFTYEGKHLCLGLPHRVEHRLYIAIVLEPLLIPKAFSYCLSHLAITQADLAEIVCRLYIEVLGKLQYGIFVVLKPTD